MEIFCFTDFHGHEAAYRNAAELAARSLPGAILVAGDIADVSVPKAERCLAHLDRTGIPTFYVPGNMDDPRLADGVRLQNAKCLHGTTHRLGSYTLIGLGGAVPGPFSTPFEYDEEDAKRILTDSLPKTVSDLILLSHCPPKMTLVDTTRTGVHAGSASVRKFIEEKKPLLAVSGHIHEARAIGMLGDTTLVNPGPAFDGNYAKVLLARPVKVELAKF